jgi:hypothetical protein
VVVTGVEVANWGWSLTFDEHPEEVGQVEVVQQDYEEDAEGFVGLQGRLEKWQIRQDGDWEMQKCKSGCFRLDKSNGVF